MYREDWQIFGMKTHWRIWRQNYWNIRQQGNFWQILRKNLCYDSMLKVLSKELTLVLSDTRELDRVSSTK